MRWRGVAISIGLLLVLIVLLTRTAAERRAASRAPQVGTGSPAASELPKDDAVMPAAGPVAARGPEHPHERVRVEVVDGETGQPIPGATVEARYGTDLADSGLTDSLGSVSLTVDRSKWVSLLAHRRGFVPAEDWLPGADHWLYEADSAPWIPLRPGIPVSGRVTHDTGEGAARAEVNVQYRLNGYLPLRPDAQGRFEIPGLPVGERVTIHIREEGYWPEELAFTAEPASPSLEIVLGRGGICEGRVVDEMARPVGGASIRIGPRTWSGLETRTDAEGRFTARGLRDSREHRVAVHTTDHRSGMSEPFQCSPDDPVHRCEIVVRPHAYVVVMLAFPDGSPVADARVALSARETDWSDQRWCAPVAGTPGLFESGPVDPGEPQLRIDVTGWPFQARKVRVSPGVRNDIAFRLEEKLGLEGVVVDAEGRPLRGIPVDFDEAPADDDQVRIAYTLTGPDGRFRLRGLGSAEGTLRFGDDDPRYVPLATDARPGQPPVRAVLARRPRVFGRLDTAPELRGLSTSIGYGDNCLGRDVLVGRDGRFELLDVPAGEEFWLKLQIEGSVPWVYTGLNLAPDEALDLGVLKPHDGVTLKGVVADDRGKPIPGAEVYASAMIEDLALWRSARTDEEGRFTITGLVDVESSVSVEAKGYVPRMIVVTRPAGAPPLTVALERAGVLRVTGADDTTDVQPLEGKRSEVLICTEEGIERVFELAPGLYRVGHEIVEIRVGETTRVDLAGGCGEEDEEDLGR